MISPVTIKLSNTLGKSFSHLFKVNGWQWGSALLASLVVMPLLVIFLSWLEFDGQIWQHLADTLLMDLLRNTLVLLFGVGFGVLLLGVSLAWLTTMCEFPGRRWFDWALMLPLAMPAYVLAFVIIGLFDFSGPIQSLLREWFGRGNYWIPPIRSEGGVIMVMVLALYPYVYMLARVAFLGQGQRLMEAAQSLGSSPTAAFFQVALPMARPAIAAGMALALMETLADFGTVAVFNYDTFTTAIYKSWYSLFNLAAAAQLASLLLLFVFLALFLERRQRRQARYHAENRCGRRYVLKGWKAWAATLFALSILLIAFVIPVMQLLYWVWNHFSRDLDSRYFSLLSNTLLLGSFAAILTVMAGLLLGFSQRLTRNVITRFSVSIATLGYALPGSVLAVGIMLSFVWFEHYLQVGFAFFNIEMNLILSGGLLGLLLAYVVRFMAVAYNPIESGLQRIRPSLHEAARGLGAVPRELLWRLYLPLLRPGLMAGFLLVFVDVMKEMPATLLLRPFGWDTLAIRIYEMTSEGEWQRAALPALTLIIIGLLPVIFLVKRQQSAH
jgi:iron(III) transport system permease protein